MASQSEYALANEVKDGPRTLISKLKSFDKADLMVDVFTSLDVTCGSGREITAGPSGQFVFGVNV